MLTQMLAKMLTTSHFYVCATFLPTFSLLPKIRGINTNVVPLITISFLFVDTGQGQIIAPLHYSEVEK